MNDLVQIDRLGVHYQRGLSSTFHPNPNTPLTHNPHTAEVYSSKD